MSTRGIIGTIDILIDSGEGDESTASLLSAQLIFTTEMKSALHPESYGWEYFIPGDQNWRAEGSVLQLVDSASLIREQYLYLLEFHSLNKTLLSFTFQSPFGAKYYGQGHIDTFQLGGAYEDGFKGSFTIQGATALTKIEPLTGRLFFHATTTNNAGSVTSAGEIIDVAGDIYERAIDGAIHRRISASPRTVSDFGIWSAGQKIIVAYTNYDIYMYDLDGSNEELVYTITGSTIDIGNICVSGDDVYVRHGTGTFSWSIVRVNLSTKTLVATYYGNGSYKYPDYIAQGDGKIYGLSGSQLSYITFHLLSQPGPIHPAQNLYSNAYSGNGQIPYGIIYNTQNDRVYAGNFVSNYWASFPNSGPAADETVIQHSIGIGSHHTYDPVGDFIWLGYAGVYKSKTAGNLLGGDYITMLHNGELLGRAEYGSFTCKRIVPYYG